MINEYASIFSLILTAMCTGATFAIVLSMRQMFVILLANQEAEYAVMMCKMVAVDEALKIVGKGPGLEQ